MVLNEPNSRVIDSNILFLGHKKKGKILIVEC